ncbi:hypothetical protein BRADI_1g49795v3 [Brachypodium distachyon]|uniref:Uncharacterized protein n=1 Tax=Brachypodium distachyon TaxID=15368 RepID=A0A2K2DQM1_BRADI|nr:hypothetical protein BRADI_1g49795v3 [Brachypodium distachyon]
MGGSLFMSPSHRSLSHAPSPPILYLSYSPAIPTKSLSLTREEGPGAPQAARRKAATATSRGLRVHATARGPWARPSLPLQLAMDSTAAVL